MKKLIELAKALANETEQGKITWTEVDEILKFSEFYVKIGDKKISVKSYFDEDQELNKILMIVIDQYDRMIATLEKNHHEFDYSILDDLYSHAMSSARDLDAAIDSIFSDLDKIK